MPLKTFADIKNECLRYGFQDGPLVNEARIEDWINEAFWQIARNIDAPEFQNTSTITLVPKQFKYSLPAGFLRMASILYPLVAVRLKPVDLQTFDSMMSAQEASQGTGIEGPPVAYTIFTKELWLFPTPSSADKIELRFYTTPGITSGTETPELSEEYLHLAVDYVLWRAYRAEDDPEMANIHQQQYEKDLMKYAADVQNLQDDRPKQLQGTWGLPL